MNDRLAEACKALNGTELWVDDNSPWRIMLKRNGSNVAVAEQHPNSAHGDGEWADGNAICAIVNEAIRSRTTAPALPVDAGEGRVPTRDIDFFGPVNGMNEPDLSGPYVRVILTKGDEQREEYRISLGAAEIAAAELAGLLDTPQLPGVSPASDALAALRIVEQHLENGNLMRALYAARAALKSQEPT